MQEREMDKIAHAICDILDAPDDEKVISNSKVTVSEICQKFPLPY
jgi:glycine/serine hydroxymethyltransferase